MPLNLDKIRKLIAAKGGQSELARRSGIPQKRLSELATGACANPTLDRLEAVAAALGCGVRDLLR